MPVKKGIDALTSLRFFAALLVFVDHYMISSYSAEWSLALGYIAMTFFFTLSGFVLTYAYCDAFSKSEITKFKFYMSRFARIWPLHILCLLIVIPFVLPEFNIHFSHTIFYLIANIFLLQDIIPHSASLFNEPSWSISAEMFFYVCFPFLILLAVNRKNTFHALLFLYFLVLVGIALFAAGHQVGLAHNLVIFHANISLAGLFYLFPLIRLFDFMTGIAIFFIYQRLQGVALKGNSYSYIEMISLVSLAVVYGIHSFFPLLIQVDLLYLPSVMMLLMVFSLQKGVISHFLAHKKLVFLGEISFAFYMLQRPVSLFLHHFLTINAMSLHCIHFMLLIPLAILAHQYFEYPCYRKIRAFFEVKQQIQSKHIAFEAMSDQIPIDSSQAKHLT